MIIFKNLKLKQLIKITDCLCLDKIQKNSRIYQNVILMQLKLKIHNLKV
jgi:hypothetical protein